MKNNNNKLNNSLFAKTFASLMVFVFAVVSVFALPGTTSTNLQTTAGVTTSTAGSTLSVTAPDKAVLTWQNFGSGTDTIGFGDTISYALPSTKSSVLNIVAGNARTSIDGYITSNGNVFVLNPNGIIINGSARIDTNGFYVSTSDIPSFAAYHFQQNGTLPSQAGYAPAAGNTSINGTAIINVTDNITIISKNIDIGGALIQGGLNIFADGAVNLGTTGVTYIGGATSINNASGVTTLGAVGGIVTSNNNVVVNSVNGTITNASGASFTAKALNANAGTGDVALGKVVSNTITAAGNNVSVAVGQVANPVVSVTANGAVSVTAPVALTANIHNTTPTAATSVVAGGALTLGNISINSAGNTVFTGTSVTDSVNNNFVYGPVLFNATAGDVSITKNGNSFGPVSVATVGTGTATVYEGAALNLGTINTSKLTARTGDFLFQTGVVTTPSANITAAKDITLNNASNAITAATISGGAIALTNTGNITLNATGTNVAVTTTGPAVLGNVTANGTLAVTSGGAITQDTGAKVRATGNSSFVGTSLALTNAGNNFGALTVDTNTGAAAISEDLTLNLASLRAGATTLSSNASVITSGTAAINAASVTIAAGADVVLGANFNSAGPLTVSAANGTVDLSALSFATNLRSVFPAVVAKNYKAPTP